MKMKYKMLSIVLGVALLLSLSANVLGASNLIEISAYLNNGINVMVHGKPFEATDPQDGSKYVPITYKGRVYLPLRAVAEAVGLEVLWDANTSTAYLGEEAEEIAKDQISWIRVSPEFVPGLENIYRLKSRQPEYLNRAPNREFEFGYSIDPNTGAGLTLGIITNYEYDKFKATFWIDDSAFNDDGGYINSPEITFHDEYGSPVHVMSDLEWGQLYEVELDIKDVKQLNIWVRGSLSIIGEPMLGK